MPDAERRERSRLLAALRRWGFGDDLPRFHAGAIEDPEWFWGAVVDDLDVEFSTPFFAVRDDSRGHALPSWFVGGRINAAHLCAHRHAVSALRDKLAVVYEGDLGQRRTLTYGQLDEQVRRFAAQLAAMGVGPADRVVLFLPVVPEAVVAFLACAMLGAVSVPAFSGFGTDALATRIADSGAKVVVTADGTTRRSRRVELKTTCDEAVPVGVRVVVVRHLGHNVPMQSGRDVYWDELPEAPPVETASTESNDPLTIIYTSGTTGRPKGIVHSHAGFSVKAAVDFAYGFDVHDDDVIGWIADMGWMLGPLLILGGLQLGATLVLVEGVPVHPHPRRLWEVADRNAVTLLGIAPTAARAIMMAGGEPDSTLPTVRSFASTGESWDEPSWHWMFSTVGGWTRPIVNYSGGTETGGGILIAYPFLPIRPTAFNGPLPGMDVTVLDQSGAPVVGEVGELAVRNTWPGMTHAFWRDEPRYLETYWSRFDDVWVHGDLASVSDEGEWRLHGRSDDTIKISGRRVGPAEIETALLRDPRIAEAAVVGVPDPARGQRVVAFVVLCGHPDDDVRDAAIRNTGKSFAPALVVVGAIPKTKNGKILRRAIRARYLGLPPGDLSSLDPATPLEDIPTELEQVHE
ncbi:acetyl-CoA synthetase [Cryptosporangium aurantiacum]|uniref:acetate--CoA ligase n=1 Tax=Cryptosporangium aurantiacum TaxID=134849 RepID=A0A1M7R3T4_9ACTN|nr:AMP-binding protein [Cryptosporangium aurantiacum]SHN39586.1 acetyl-CoA synthetase [Cryptosporangium aurantiacum]